MNPFIIPAGASLSRLTSAATTFRMPQGVPVEWATGARVSSPAALPGLTAWDFFGCGLDCSRAVAGTAALRPPGAQGRAMMEISDLGGLVAP